MALKKKEPVLAGGMTAREHEEVRLRKQNKDLDMIPANRRDKIQDELFREQYKNHEIPMHHRKVYHVIMENRLFSQTNGKRLSAPIVQTFDQTVWNTQVKDSDVFKSYTSEILHDPTLEAKDAPMVVLAYTLTDEEIEAEKSTEAVPPPPPPPAPKAEKPKAPKAAPAPAPAPEPAPTPEPNTTPAPAPEATVGGSQGADETEEEEDDGEWTIERIDAITDPKVAKALLQELTGTKPSNKLQPHEVKAKIKEFLGLEDQTGSQGDQNQNQ